MMGQLKLPQQHQADPAHHLSHHRHRHANAVSATNLSYAMLLQQMMQVRLAAPYYIVMAGVASGEGAVLARNQTTVEGSVLRAATWRFLHCPA